jgi:F-type H+-transporting ATPase subunit epsilon
MAHEPFPVEVLTPEGWAYKGEASMVSTRTSIGQIGVLARHEPLLATLEPTELRLHMEDGEIKRFAQAEGYIQMFGNRTLVLVEEAIPPEDLDVSELRNRLEEAERDLANAEEGTDEHRTAERTKRRLEAFLAVAEGSTGS